MPLLHRSDFKQALSTLQRLQQEAGEKHKQWEVVELANIQVCMSSSGDVNVFQVDGE